MKRKVCVVVTARPSYSRIKTALLAMKKHPNIELQLVVAASALLDKYGNVVNEIINDGFEITSRVYNVVEGENLVTSAKTAGLGIIELSTVFLNIKPDVIVTIADRYETIATAIAASYMNIPLAHIQGGEVTGNIDEKVRHAITKLSDLHFVATDKARERVLKMGENSEKVFVTGCPSIDIAHHIVEQSDTLHQFDPVEKYPGVGRLLENRERYVVVMQHPVTTEIEKSKDQILATLEAVSEIGKQVYWFWPNVDAGSDVTSKGIRMFREKRNPDNIYFFKNMSPEDFLILLKNSDCIIGNSSVAIRECSYLGVPAINIGSRQVGRERGRNVIDTGYDKNAILDAYYRITLDHKVKDKLYGDGRAGERIAEIIAEVPLTNQKILSY